MGAYDPLVTRLEVDGRSRVIRLCLSGSRSRFDLGFHPTVDGDRYFRVVWVVATLVARHSYPLGYVPYDDVLREAEGSRVLDRVPARAALRRMWGGRWRLVRLARLGPPTRHGAPAFISVSSVGLKPSSAARLLGSDARRPSGATSSMDEAPQELLSWVLRNEVFRCSSRDSEPMSLGLGDPLANVRIDGPLELLPSSTPTDGGESVCPTCGGAWQRDVDRTVFIAGSDDRRRWSPLVAELARQLNKRGFFIVAGDGVGVGKVAADAVFKALQLRTYSDLCRHVWAHRLPADPESADPPPMDSPLRRELVQMARFVVCVRGSTGTSGEVGFALALGRILIPIASTEGAASKVRRDQLDPRVRAFLDHADNLPSEPPRERKVRLGRAVAELIQSIYNEDRARAPIDGGVA